jgi:hypothetical protein
LEKTYFIITAVIIALFILAVLFIKPYGQTLPVFLKNAFIFTFKPKIYIWRKGYQSNPVEIKNKKPKIISKKTKRKVSSQEIRKAIQSLDVYE